MFLFFRIPKEQINIANDVRKSHAHKSLQKCLCPLPTGAGCNTRVFRLSVHDSRPSQKLTSTGCLSNKSICQQLREHWLLQDIPTGNNCGATISLRNSGSLKQEIDLHWARAGPAKNYAFLPFPTKHRLTQLMLHCTLFKSLEQQEKTVTI